MTLNHPFRTHHCGELTGEHERQRVRLSGWVHRKRDHGNLVFLDLRDHYGITQCLLENTSPLFSKVETLKNETVITVDGCVVRRSSETVNVNLVTGSIEVIIESLTIQSLADPLPFNVNSDQECPEETRLTYRFLDLRREKLHHNIVLRSQIIASLRRRMIERGFLEYQTPILTSSSPEGARDFLVPSRLHPGQFYALPQAPQQFKQLLMVAGFDRYFQIAPCFRDEDARADRCPGEFYQLDMEMAFVTQEDVFNTMGPVLEGVFKEFGSGSFVSPHPFPHIPYQEALLHYGTDAPDLRNPLRIQDVTPIFAKSDFLIFANSIETGAVVRAIPAPQASKQPRKFFDRLNQWAQDQGWAGLGYITFLEEGPKGPIAKFLDPDRMSQLRTSLNLRTGDSVFFVCDLVKIANQRAGLARTQIALDLGILENDTFRFCWVVDFPMYEENSETGKIEFSHNPFSMPQGGLEALETQDPRKIKAYQYDIVCNGLELSSGAIRNHLPSVMIKAFEIAGYSQQVVEEQFGGMLNAFRYGAPPHGGSAPGIDRIVRLLARASNLREVVAFPMNQRAQDLLMKAPCLVQEERLKELHIQIRRPHKN